MSLRARLATLIAVVALVVVVAGLWRARHGSWGEGARPGAPSPPATVPFTALTGASGWLNGGPIAPSALRGHPVLIVVWSDTDPVSLRWLPEVDAWQRAYGRFGLSVVGVHLPDYAFATDSLVPAAALRRLGVRVPVALDASYRIASRLAESAELPEWILADGAGHRVLDASGDRAEEVHHALRELLRRERPDAGIPEVPPSTVPHIPLRRIACGTSQVASGPLVGAKPGHTAMFTAQFRYQEEGELFTPYLVGRWTPTAEGVTSARGGASDYLALRTEGGRLDAVASAAPGGRARVWLLCDDAWVPDSIRGEDIRTDARGATYVDVDEPRLYSIVRGGGAHVLKLSPEAPGVTFYEFTLLAE